MPSPRRSQPRAAPGGPLWIRRAENRAPGDQDIGARRDHSGCVRGIDSAVHFDGRVAAVTVQQRADRLDLRLGTGDEGLTSEARVHRHHQHVIEIAGDFLEHADRGRRIDGDAGLCPEFLDVLNGAMEMREHFEVNRDHRRAGTHERFDVPVRVLDHQVHVERNLRHLPDRHDHRRPHCQVRHEMAVHDVDVDQVGPASLYRCNPRPQRGEIGRQDGRGNPHLHRLTSSEIGSPGAIWNPACGPCRSTTPEGTPG